MIFLNNRQAAAEDSAFLERLSGITARGKANQPVDPIPDAVADPGVQRRFWSPSELAAAAEGA